MGDPADGMALALNLRDVCDMGMMARVASPWTSMASGRHANANSGKVRHSAVMQDH
ncbi:MAG: hypothetical protein J0H27_01220 [Xanthomonadales bacterium]|nr:hypothetical protein [Xanthomonadales bacterium]